MHGIIRKNYRWIFFIIVIIVIGHVSVALGTKHIDGNVSKVVGMPN